MVGGGRIYAVSSIALGENVLFMPVVKGEWPDYFELTGRQQ